MLKNITVENNNLQQKIRIFHHLRWRYIITLYRIIDKFSQIAEIWQAPEVYRNCAEVQKAFLRG